MSEMDTAEHWQEPKITVMRGIASGGTGGDPTAIDSKDGKIVRIKPLRWDAKYSKEELAPNLWEIEAQEKRFACPMSAPQLLVERMHQGILENKDFYVQVNRIEHGNFLPRELAAKIAALNTQILKDYDVPELEKSYMAYFFAAANATLICKWIENGMDVEPKELAHFFNKWALQYWSTVAPFKRDW